MQSRRSVLASLGVGALAGCLGPEAGSGPSGSQGARGSRPNANASTNGTAGEGGTTDTDDAETATGTTENEPAEATESDQTDETVDPALESRGPVRAENDAVPSVRSVEDDETLELTENGTVRFVAAWRHTNHEERQEGEPPEREPVYETSEWENWAEIQAVTAAQAKASGYAADELDVDDVGGAVSSSISDGEGVDAVVSTTTTLDREGDVVGEPSVAFDDLVTATPHAVEVTYVMEERTYETTVPVYVEHTVAQYS